MWMSIPAAIWQSLKKNGDFFWYFLISFILAVYLFETTISCVVANSVITQTMTKKCKRSSTFKDWLHELVDHVCNDTEDLLWPVCCSCYRIKPSRMCNLGPLSAWYWIMCLLILNAFLRGGCSYTAWLIVMHHTRRSPLWKKKHKKC